MTDINFKSLYDKEHLELDCPKCLGTILITLNDAGKTIKCPRCSEKIKLD